MDVPDAGTPSEIEMTVYSLINTQFDEKFLKKSYAQFYRCHATMLELWLTGPEKSKSAKYISLGPGYSAHVPF